MAFRSKFTGKQVEEKLNIITDLVSGESGGDLFSGKIFQTTPQGNGDFNISIDGIETLDDVEKLRDKTFFIKIDKTLGDTTPINLNINELFPSFRQLHIPTLDGTQLETAIIFQAPQIASIAYLTLNGEDTFLLLNPCIDMFSFAILKTMEPWFGGLMDASQPILSFFNSPRSLDNMAYLASNSIEEVMDKANEAYYKAESAENAATEALNASANIDIVSNDAYNALQAANDATGIAQSAETTANEAYNKANEAMDRANEAYDKAEEAMG